MPKRCPKPKDDLLRMCYTYTGEDGWDIYFIRGEGVPKRDGRMLSHYMCSERPRVTLPVGSPPKFDPSLLDELEARGYDITTLNFTIEKKRNES